MNILLAHHAPWVGGTRTHVLGLARELRRRGHHAVLMTDGGVLQEEMAARGIPFLIRPATGLSQFYREAICRERIELLHAHTPATVIECGRIAAQTGLPWVATIHGEYTAGFDDSPEGHDAARSVHTVVAVSDMVGRYLMENSSLSPHKIRVIANGIDTDEFRPVSGCTARQELGLRHDDFVVMYLGRLESDKSPAIWATAKAVRLLRTWGMQARGVLVGGGSLWAEVECFNRENASPGCEAPLILTGVRRDLSALIAACDVMIASGRSALEGMSSGKPLIAVGRGGYLGLVVPERWETACRTNFADHGAWPSPEPVEVARQLQRLRFDRSLTNELGLQLRDLVIRDHHISDAAERTLEVYRTAGNGCSLTPGP